MYNSPGPGGVYNTPPSAQRMAMITNSPAPLTAVGALVAGPAFLSRVRQAVDSPIGRQLVRSGANVARSLTQAFSSAAGDRKRQRVLPGSGISNSPYSLPDNMAFTGHRYRRGRGGRKRTKRRTNTKKNKSKRTNRRSSKQFKSKVKGVVLSTSETKKLDVTWTGAQFGCGKRIQWMFPFIKSGSATYQRQGIEIYPTKLSIRGHISVTNTILERIANATADTALGNTTDLISSRQPKVEEYMFRILVLQLKSRGQASWAQHEVDMQTNANDAFTDTNYDNTLQKVLPNMTNGTQKQTAQQEKRDDDGNLVYQQDAQGNNIIDQPVMETVTVKEGITDSYHDMGTGDGWTWEKWIYAADQDDGDPMSDSVNNYIGNKGNPFNYGLFIRNGRSYRKKKNGVPDDLYAQINKKQFTVMHDQVCTLNSGGQKSLPVALDFALYKSGTDKLKFDNLNQDGSRNNTHNTAGMQDTNGDGMGDDPTGGIDWDQDEAAGYSNWVTNPYIFAIIPVAADGDNFEPDTLKFHGAMEFRYKDP